jgi:hypothetical protein
MKAYLAKGDRVRRPAIKKGETDKDGAVSAVYYGQKSAVDNGVPLADVVFDDGSVGEGYINTESTSLVKLPTAVAQ